MRPRALLVYLFASTSAFAVLSCSHETERAKSASAPKVQETRTNTESVSTTEVTSAVTLPDAPTTADGRRVREVVEGHLADVVDRCGGLQTDNDRYLTTLHFEIAPSGAVESVRASGNVRPLDACVENVARGWTFYAANGRRVTNVAIELTRPSPAK